MVKWRDNVGHQQFHPERSAGCNRSECICWILRIWDIGDYTFFESNLLHFLWNFFGFLFQFDLLSHLCIFKHRSKIDSALILNGRDMAHTYQFD